MKAYPGDLLIKSLKTLCLLIFVLAYTGAWAAGAEICTLKPGVLKVAIANTFPPVVMTDSNGKPGGFDVEFLTRFASENKLAIEWVNFPFDGIWKRAANDEVDIAANGISPLASRKTAGMHFSAPYIRIQRTLIIRKADAAQLRTIKDFGGKKIGYVAGAIPELDLKKRALKSTTLVDVKSFADGIEALRKGQIDAVGEGDVTSNYFVKDQPDLAVVDSHEYDPKSPETLTFAIRDKGCGLSAQLNNFIRTRTYPSGEVKARK